MNTHDRIAQLEAQLAATQERLEQVAPQSKRPEVPGVDQILNLALEKAGGDAVAASDLFWAWAQASSEVRDSLRPLIREAIERRLQEAVR